jgi:hypothetical protein
MVKRPGISPRPKMAPHRLPSQIPCRRTRQQKTSALLPARRGRRSTASANAISHAVDVASCRVTSCHRTVDPGPSQGHRTPHPSHRSSLLALTRPSWRGGKEGGGRRAASSRYQLPTRPASIHARNSTHRSLSPVLPVFAGSSLRGRRGEAERDVGVGEAVVRVLRICSAARTYVYLIYNSNYM